MSGDSAGGSSWRPSRCSQRRSSSGATYLPSRRLAVALCKPDARNAALVEKNSEIQVRRARDVHCRRQFARGSVKLNRISTKPHLHSEESERSGKASVTRQPGKQGNQAKQPSEKRKLATGLRCVRYNHPRGPESKGAIRRRRISSHLWFHRLSTMPLAETRIIARLKLGAVDSNRHSCKRQEGCNVEELPRHLCAQYQ